MNKNYLFLLVISIFFVSCADTHNIIRNAPSNLKKLPKNASFYIAIPKDGTYGSTTYSNSGIMTAQAILGALARHATHARVAEQYLSIDDSKTFATQNNYDYLINSTILHWEDRKTEWSGKQDKVTVKIEIITIPDGLVVDSALIEGKSKWATFGGEHPQDLIPKPIGNYFDQLF